MPNNSKQLNRRDAIKLLGAVAGASVLANIPAKWSKPELSGGVLPAHAQTSTIYGINCGDSLNVDANTNPLNYDINMGGQLDAAVGGLDINCQLTFNNITTVNAPAPADFNGTIQSIFNGSFLIYVDITTTTLPASIVAVFSIGAAQCTQTVNFIVPP